MPTTAGCPDFAYLPDAHAPRGRAAARRRRDARRQDQPRPVRHRADRDPLAVRRVRERLRRRPDLRRVQLRLGRRGRRRAWSASPWAPTPPAPGGCRPRSTASSGSSRPAACSAPPAWCPACRSLDCVSVFAARRRRRLGRPARGAGPDRGGPLVAARLPVGVAPSRAAAAPRGARPTTSTSRFGRRRAGARLRRPAAYRPRGWSSGRHPVDLDAVARGRRPAVRGAVGRRAARRPGRLPAGARRVGATRSPGQSWSRGARLRRRRRVPRPAPAAGARGARRRGFGRSRRAAAADRRRPRSPSSRSPRSRSRRNRTLGRYTQFANLLDLAAVAVPNGHHAGRPAGELSPHRAGVQRRHPGPRWPPRSPRRARPAGRRGRSAAGTIADGMVCSPWSATTCAASPRNHELVGHGSAARAAPPAPRRATGCTGLPTAGCPAWSGSTPGGGARRSRSSCGGCPSSRGRVRCWPVSAPLSLG